MKKTRRRIISICEPVFKSHTLFVFNCSWEEARVYLNKKYDLEIEDTRCFAANCQEYDKPPYQVIWLKNLSWDKEQVSILAHELVHLSNRLCKKRNIPTYPSIDNLIMDETNAYLLEYYMLEVLNRL